MAGVAATAPLPSRQDTKLMPNCDRFYAAAQEDGLVILERSLPPPRLEPSVRLDASGCHLSFQGDMGQAVHL